MSPNDEAQQPEMFIGGAWIGARTRESLAVVNPATLKELARVPIASAGAGHFWRPTLLAEVPDSALAMKEEPFGPIAIANPFDTLEGAVRQANRLPYGLAAYAFTTSMQRSIAISDALECGVVGVNNLTVSIAEAPFGGVKESGYGSEAGQEGLEAFLNPKFISEV